ELENPDLIVTAHPFVTMVIRSIKEEGANFKSVTMITDLVTLFRGWGDPSADLVICPTGEAIPTLLHYGVNVENIVYPLFPIKPNMDQVVDREEIVKRHNLDPEKTIVLVTGGGVGTKPMM